MVVEGWVGRGFARAAWRRSDGWRSGVGGRGSRSARSARSVSGSAGAFRALGVVAPAAGPADRGACGSGPVGFDPVRHGFAAPDIPSLHQLPYEGNEFGRLEGLGEERVDPDVEPGLNLVLRTGADDGERKASRPGVATEPGGGTEAVEAGHDHVEGDEVGPHLMNDVQALGTISRGHHLEALQLEIDPDQLPDDLVVVHNKHPAGRAWHNSRVGPRPPPRPGFPHFHPLRAVSPQLNLTLHTRKNPFMISLGELVGFYPSPPNKAPDTPP